MCDWANEVIGTYTAEINDLRQAMTVMADYLYNPEEERKRMLAILYFEQTFRTLKP